LSRISIFNRNAGVESGEDNIPEFAPANDLPPEANLAAITPQPARRRIRLIIFGVIVFVLLGIYFSIQPLARKHLSAKLHEAGFAEARVENVLVHFGSVTAHNIKLDSFGFDEIKLIDAQISWPAFLLGGEIKSLTLDGIHLGRDASSLSSTAKQTFDGLLKLPRHRIDLKNVTLDVTTDFGELRFTGEATLNGQDNPGGRDIRARIKSEQFQLGFDSTWQGVLSENGTLDLTAEVEGGRLNMGPLRISRFNGWIGGRTEAGAFSIQSMLEAGSAEFMNIPLQSLSLVGDYSNEATTVMFRSGISGLPDIVGTADYIRTGTQEPTFNANLTGDGLGNFLDYIEEATGRKKNIRDTLLEIGAFQLEASYEAEKRFVGGPLPFALSLRAEEGALFNGTFLFYPDTLDVRGSLETTTDIATGLQEYFKIPSENMRQTYIRLDGSLQRFFVAPAELPAVTAE
jgi:hypothetical protein